MKEKLSAYTPADYERECSAPSQPLATPALTKPQVKLKLRIPHDVRAYYSCYFDGSLNSAIDELMEQASIGRLNVVNLPPVGEPQATMFNAQVAASHPYYTTLRDHYSHRDFNLSALLTDFAEQDGATLLHWPVLVASAELTRVRATLATQAAIRQERRVTTRSLVPTHSTTPLLTGESATVIPCQQLPTLLDTATFLDSYESFVAAVAATRTSLATLATLGDTILADDLTEPTTLSEAVTALSQSLDDTNRVFCEVATTLGYAVIFDERSATIYTTLLQDTITAERQAVRAIDAARAALPVEG